MSGTTFTVQNQAALLLEFEDGQAAGSILPVYVRNLIGSVGPLAFVNKSAPYYNAGTLSTSNTLSLANGSLQYAVLPASGNCTITVASTGLLTGWWYELDLFLFNNNSSATLVWGSNVYYPVDPSPQPIALSGTTTKFKLESIDAGTTWSITL